MSQLTRRLERGLGEVAAGAQPSPSAWESILARLDDDTESEHAFVLAPASTRSRRPAWPAVAAAVLVLIIGSIAVVTRAGDDESISADLTATFVSPRNGFSIQHSEGATVTPAEVLLGESARADDGFDVVDTGSAAVFRGASRSLDNMNVPGSVEERVDGYLSYLSSEDFLPDHCGVPRNQQAEVTIDGQPGRIAECPNHIEATVITGGRLYLFTLTHDRSDARALFDALVATIDLTPGTAIDYPPMRTPFVSPTYGYSLKRSERGALTPATEIWDPGDQPVAAVNFDPRFDAFETGYAAYFEGASTPIPGGVSIDAWVDEYVTSRAAGGCGVPRSQQAEITIDGEPGRIAQCGWSEATVVAGGRLYLFSGPHDDREWFEAWVATIELTPETATVP